LQIIDVARLFGTLTAVLQQQATMVI